MENIHPNLKKEAFFVRFGLPAFIIFSILPLIIVFIILQVTLSFNFIRTISLFLGVLILSVIVTVIFLKVFSKYKQNVLRASHLLFHSKPEKGVIQPECLKSVWGPIFNVVTKEGTSDLISLKIQKSGIKKMYSQSVELFKDNKSTDDMIVVRNGNSYMIGKLHNHKKAEEIAHEYRKIKKIFIAGATVAILVLILAQVFHYYSIKSDAAFAVKTKDWPTINGTILSSRINEVRIKQGKTHVKGFEAAIMYSYNLDGKEYRNSTIHLAYEAGTNYDYANYYVNKYPRGSTQFIYYNPDDHSFALLEAGHEEDIIKEISEVYIVTGAVAGILIITSILLIFVFRNQEDKAIEFFKVRLH